MAGTATLSLAPNLVGKADKPKIDGWLVTLKVGSGSPTIVKVESEKVGGKTLTKSLHQYVQAGYKVIVTTHDKAGAVEQKVTYTLRGGEVVSDAEKVGAKRKPKKAAAATTETLKPGPRVKAAAGKKTPKRWTLKRARALAERWADIDPKDAREFLDTFKANGWSDEECDVAQKNVAAHEKRVKAAAAKAAEKQKGSKGKAAKKSAKGKAAKKPVAESLAAPDKGQKKKRKPSAYSRFMGTEIKRLIATGTDSKSAMSEAAANWRARK